MRTTSRRLAAHIATVTAGTSRRWATAELVTVAGWLARHGVDEATARSKRSWFGRHLAKLYRETHGCEPMKRVQDIDTRNGQRTITAAGYLPAALPLFAAVAERMGIDVRAAA